MIPATGAENTLLEIYDISVSPEAPLDIHYPGLLENSAICIGLSIDWQYSQTLHDFCLKHTHAEEHVKAAHFRKNEDSLRHLLGRALLRSLAIRYAHMRPDQLIMSNSWGKPEPVVPPMCCNLSHSGNQVWAAIANFPNVGIDVESAKAPSGYREIMRSFHPDEIAALLSMPDSSDAMMRCWTRKEAICKAIGLGFGMPLATYAVDCYAKPESWLRIAPTDSQAKDWTTIDLPVTQDYVGALAIEGRCNKITVIRLDTRAFEG